MVTIKELPDGLELRSTSWIEVSEKAREYADLARKDSRTCSLPYWKGMTALYEFIEDHIEIMDYIGRYRATPDEQGFVAIPRKIEYVIRLKRLDKTA